LPSVAWFSNGGPAIYRGIAGVGRGVHDGRSGVLHPVRR
jgi:hypothetical protein